jgi:hypothetical protein
VMVILFFLWLFSTVPFHAVRILSSVRSATFGFHFGLAAFLNNPQRMMQWKGVKDQK